MGSAWLMAHRFLLSGFNAVVSENGGPDEIYQNARHRE
jgi:hypothetical protein